MIGDLALRKILVGIESGFTAGWSLGELAFAMRKMDRVRSDPFRDAVLEEVDKGGLYRRFEGEVQSVTVDRKGWIRLPNPYVRIGFGGGDQIVAKLGGGRPRERRLLIVCHCYGLPFPSWMGALFGLKRLQGYDVVFNIMNHHQSGSYLLWPGFGFSSPQMSRMVENVRSAFTGLRSLARSMVHSYGYEEVALLGYSIGGHICLHAANSMEVDKLVTYCPVTSLRATATELGMMKRVSSAVDKTMGRVRGDFSFEDLDLINPLLHEVKVSHEEFLIILQRRDAMVPMNQSAALLARYPNVRSLEYPGTHAFPVARKAMETQLRLFLERPVSRRR